MTATLAVWAALARRRGASATGAAGGGGLTGRLADLPAVLAVLAFATATWAALAVAGGTVAFVHRADAPGAVDEDGVYPLLAAISCVLLVVPVATLGGAAARLTVARRNDRLAKLRLMGATGLQVAGLAVLDTTLEAVTGAVAGLAVWAVSLPALARVRFQGRAFAVAELVPDAAILLAVPAAVLLIALTSCAASLRRVAITPLGVARRVTPRRLSPARILPLLVLAGAFVAVTRAGPGFADSDRARAVAAAVLLALIGGTFAVYNLVGPLLIGLLGRLLARTARTPATLLAARQLVDDPRSAWRGVGGVALVTFVAGCLSIVPGLRSTPGNQDRVLADIGTGAAATLAIAALMAAVSTGVTQAARVLDQAPQYRALHLGGADLAVLHAARSRQTWIPLAVTMGGAGLTSLVIVSPVAALLASAGVRGVAVFVLSAVSGAGLVLVASRASRPLVVAVSRP